MELLREDGIGELALLAGAAGGFGDQPGHARRADGNPDGKLAHLRDQLAHLGKEAVEIERQVAYLVDSNRHDLTR